MSIERLRLGVLEAPHFDKKGRGHYDRFKKDPTLTAERASIACGLYIIDRRDNQVLFYNDYLAKKHNLPPALLRGVFEQNLDHTQLDEQLKDKEDESTIRIVDSFGDEFGILHFMGEDSSYYQQFIGLEGTSIDAILPLIFPNAPTEKKGVIALGQEENFAKPKPNGEGEEELDAIAQSTGQNNRLSPLLRLGLNHEVLSFAQTISLMRKMERPSTTDEDRQQARKVIIQNNARLVHDTILHFLGRGLSMDELFQEGNIGLQRATEKYEWRKGHQFSTYATSWIRQACSRAIRTVGRMVNLPPYLYDHLNHIRIAQQELMAMGQEPTAEQIARQLDLAPEFVRTIIRGDIQPSSLDKKMREGEEDTVGSRIPDRYSPSVEEQGMRRLIASDMVRTLGGFLLENERIVLQLHFGIGTDTGLTYGEIGERLGLPEYQVKKITHDALAKLRSNPEARERLRTRTTAVTK